MKFLLTVSENSAVAIDKIAEILNDHGLKMERSFDMRLHPDESIPCSCPHHGTSKCDCQIVVLLIYGNIGGPETVVAHSRDGRTVFSLATRPDAPQQVELIHIFHNIGNVIELPR